jgi:hypothetical protein
METVCCAVCRQTVPLDSDHVEITAEITRIRDRDDRDDYVLHTECWHSISDGWMTPA